MGPVGSTILSHVSSLPTSFDVLLLASIYLLICRCKYTTSTYHYGRSKNGIVKFDLFFLFFVIYYFKKCILIIEAELLLGLRHGSCWRQGLTVFQVHPWGRRACLRSIGGQEWWVPWPWATLESKLLQRFGLKRQKKTPHILRCIITALRKGSGVDIVMGAGKCISSLNPVLLCLRYPHPRLAQSPQIKV